MPESYPDRLRELDDAAFELFIRRFAETVWNGWEIAISPPSPDRSVDVRLSHSDHRELLHVKHRPAESPVGAPAVRDLADLHDRREFESVTLAATTTITDPARAVAADRGVGILDAIPSVGCAPSWASKSPNRVIVSLNFGKRSKPTPRTGRHRSPNAPKTSSTR